MVPLPTAKGHSLTPKSCHLEDTPQEDRQLPHLVSSSGSSYGEKNPYTHFTDWNTMGGSPVTPGVCLSTLLFKNSQLTRFTRLRERPANMPLRPLPSCMSSEDNDSRCLWETGQRKGPQQLRGTK